MARSPSRIIRLSVRTEADVVLARQRARQVAALLQMDTVTQTRLATAVSEVARNALMHGGGGTLDLYLHGGAKPRLLVRISDNGPGLPAASREVAADDTGEAITIGIRSGGGLAVARRLAAYFDVETSDRGTIITLGMPLPASVRADASAANAVGQALAKRPPETLLEELHRQNQEILGVLEDLLNRQEELVRLNQELEETNRGVLALHHELTRELEQTNRGVLALYGELDERSEQLRRSNALKDQFISYLSHEFRTPVHSVTALAQILLEGRTDPLTAEQQTQVRLIRRSSGTLLDLVDDLLDLAKISAGRLTVSPEVFLVSDLFGALRGMMRPLVPGSAVRLVVEEAGAVQPLYTDQGKLSQILRNLVSNALKFTTEGEVRVSVRANGHDRVTFAVSDTGIGIARGDVERIFRDYEQVQGPFQRQRKGTGLGLPLSRRLAELLGGELTVESAPGVGSTFRLHLPIRIAPESAEEREQRTLGMKGEERPDILVVDDDEAARYVLRHLLESLGCRVTEATNGQEALRSVRQQRPGAIIADLVMPGMDGFELVERLAADPHTKGIPILVRTGKRLGHEERQRLECNVAEVLTKDEGAGDRERAALRVGAALARLGITTAGESDRAGGA